MHTRDKVPPCRCHCCRADTAYCLLLTGSLLLLIGIATRCHFGLLRRVVLCFSCGLSRWPSTEIFEFLMLFGGARAPPPLTVYCLLLMRELLRSKRACSALAGASVTNSVVPA